MGTTHFTRLTVFASLLLAAGCALADFSIVVLPDTQAYTQDYPDIFEGQTEWIRDNITNRNIELVLHVGDIVNSNVAAQWDVARSKLGMLDGAVPYALTLGNHDYTGHEYAQGSLFDLPAYFGPGSPYASQSGYGGSYASDRMEASFHTYRIDSTDWLVVSIPWQAPIEVLDWANTVVSNHADHLALVVTHDYLVAPGNTRSSNGAWMWDNFVRKHENIFMVLCGHAFPGGGVLTSVGDNGNTVYQMLSCYHFVEPNGGNGWLRIMNLSPTGRADVATYSPYLDQWDTSAGQQFSFEFTNSYGATVDLGFGSGSGSGAESVSSVAVEVELHRASASTVTVDYVVGGTSSGGEDHNLAAGSLTFLPGATVASISFDVVDDSAEEHDETVVISLVNPSNAVLGAVTGHVYMIVDNDPDTWARPYRMEIDFGGYGGSETLTNFPLLLVLSESLPGFLYSQSGSADGSDLRFGTDDSNAWLKYEIERWDTQGNSLVWVRVPGLAPGGDISMYWGGTKVGADPGGPQPEQVWSPDYAGVWHLESDGTDSGPGQHHGSVSNLVVAAQGVVGGGLEFDGNGGVLVDDYTRSADELTVTVWAWADSVPASAAIACNAGATEAGQFRLGLYGTTGRVAGWIKESDQDEVDVIHTGRNGLPLGEWHHLALVTRDGQLKLFRNGTNVSAVIPGYDGTLLTGFAPLGIGAQPDDEGGLGGYGWDGVLDEVRISRVGRSAEWIEACFLNQSSPASFCGYGPVVTDADNDGLIDAWEVGYFGTITNADDTTDCDGDRFSDCSEQEAGTDPSDRASCLSITGMRRDGIDGGVLEWQSVSSRYYTVLSSGALIGEDWTVLDGPLAATPPLNVYTVPTDKAGPVYFRIGLSP